MSAEPLLPHSSSSKEPREGWEDNVVVISLPAHRSTRRRLVEGAFWLGTPVVLGVVLGLLLPPSNASKCPVMPDPLARLSAVIGWVYFCAWSISFYPQAYSNWRRKSVAGLSLDFQLLNLLGFGCYAAYNAALFWNPTVRSQYVCTHGGSLPAVHANDVFFALHAAVVTAITLVQCCIYDRGGQRVSWAAALGTGGAVAGVGAYLAAVLAAQWQQPGGGGGGAHTPLGGALAAAAGSGFSFVPGGGGGGATCGGLLSWLSFLYVLSYIKLAVSLVKYIPQVYLNYRLRSTAGWNMHNVALDFGGGLLSLVQLLLDGAVTQNWTAVTGNPVKFGLGFASMFFDVIFMVQHFCLYPAAAHGQFWPAAADDEEAAAAAARGAKRGSGGTPALPAPVRDAEAALGTSETDPMLVPTPQQPLPLR